MREINGKAKTVRKLLEREKYSIDYYQREYKWGEKQIHELIDDLTHAFSGRLRPKHERRAVKGYGHYFLGSIIISDKDKRRFIVDGQQRLTTLTLLLIYLHNQQREMRATSSVVEMIFSEQFGEKTFNIEVDERVACMEALFEHRPFDEPTSRSPCRISSPATATSPTHFSDGVDDEAAALFCGLAEGECPSRRDHSLLRR